jgi:hypothetical protein
LIDDQIVVPETFMEGTPAWHASSHDDQTTTDANLLINGRDVLRRVRLSWHVS